MESSSSCAAAAKGISWGVVVLIIMFHLQTVSQCAPAAPPRVVPARNGGSAASPSPGQQCQTLAALRCELEWRCLDWSSSGHAWEQVNSCLWRLGAEPGGSRQVQAPPGLSSSWTRVWSSQIAVFNQGAQILPKSCLSCLWYLQVLFLF